MYLIEVSSTFVTQTFVKEMSMNPVHYYFNLLKKTTREEPSITI